MFLYIENTKNSPFYNLALEQTVFDKLDRQHSYCMLWQNHSAVIVGKHQNTAAEINGSFVESRGISVVRRISGGGAVYHDLGNINFTFIVDANSGGIDFTAFCRPIQAALRSFGVPVEISGRNDMTVDGKKISGNAQYISRNRVLHHGTLLYDSDLSVLGKALNPKGKIISKGIKSVRSNVTNIRPFMETDMPVADFRTTLRDYLFTALEMQNYTLTVDEKTAAEHLRDTVYSQWSWNYGSSPPYNVRKNRYVDGCGTVEVFLDIEKDGLIKNILFYGDFFSSEDPTALSALLKGRHLEPVELYSVLKDVNISRYFHNMKNETFLSLILE